MWKTFSFAFVCAIIYSVIIYIFLFLIYKKTKKLMQNGGKTK